MKKSKILSIIVSATGDSIRIGEKEVNHALEKHFRIPKIKLLEIIEQILIDPTEVYLDTTPAESPHSTTVKSYHLFYRLDNGGFLVVVVKKLPEGNFFSTIYPTGKSIRKAHRNLKKVKL